jgi:hypothetical protein
MACRGEIPSPPPGTGTITVDTTPICDPSDPAQVVAPQRIALLSSTQFMNMIRLVSNDVADMIVDNAIYDVTTDFQARFPPAQFEPRRSIPNATELSFLDAPARKVGDYVRDNFAAVTGCASPAVDDCAIAYLDALAAKMYRRQLTAGEQARFTALYDDLKTQTVNDQQVTLTVEQATGFAVHALLLSPQLLWRWEIGSEVSSSPPGVYLTDAELASNLSFFLTDQPPDDDLIADVNAGTLRAHLAAHVDRILATRTARDWLTHVMETYFTLNQLPGVAIDPTKFPIVAGGYLYADLQAESHAFLDDALWSGKVTDLLTSRKGFLNSYLAPMIYGVPVPAGATPTSFVETTLPADQRSGMLTNAGFLTTRYRSEGVGLVPRGLAVKWLFTCTETPPPPDTAIGPSLTDQAARSLDTLTAQEQVAFRAENPPCASCHASFDPYGLVLDWYDVVGRYRTVDDLGKPVDGHTKLPPEVGGAEVQSAVELADLLSKNDVFTNCMARSALQYALIDQAVQVPLPSHNQAGCAAAGVAHQLRQSSTQSFTDLLRAIATSPAFILRQVPPMDAALELDPENTAAAPSPADDTLANLASRRRGLEFVAQELDLLRQMGPTEVRQKLDNHYNAAVTIADSITTAINTSYPTPAP